MPENYSASENQAYSQQIENLKKIVAVLSSNISINEKLGLGNNPTHDEIRSACFKLLKQVHLDVVNSNPFLTDNLKSQSKKASQILIEVLTNGILGSEDDKVYSRPNARQGKPQKRQTYDWKNTYKQKPQPDIDFEKMKREAAEAFEESKAEATRVFKRKKAEATKAFEENKRRVEENRKKR